ncbi:MAG: hypothetical protein WCH05_01400 [Chlorobiaceae bacterium]
MAAFDFGVKADVALFQRQINGGYDVDVSGYIRRAWEMFREHVGEFIGFTLIVIVLSSLSSHPFGSLLFSALATPLYAGYAIVAFKLSVGQEIEFSDFFKGFNYFLPLFLAGLAMGLLVSVGFVLLILPGIYLAVGYTFAIYLIVDHRMEFWQAMETSRKIVTKHWFRILWVGVVLAAVNLLGLLALGVGLLVSLPVSACAAAIAYREIIGLHSVEW